MTDPSLKLLVVDDLEDWRKTIGGVLEDYGFRVSVAGSSKDAVSMLATTDYDLVLLDLRLDETDEKNVEGLTLAKTIRGCWPDIKIIIVTGYETPEVVQHSMEWSERGARLLDDFLTKGNTDKLVETVHRIFAK